MSFHQSNIKENKNLMALNYFVCFCIIHIAFSSLIRELIRLFPHP